MTQQAPRIGVGAVILDSDNRLLLVYRNREPEKGTWSIPGGKVDPYEPLEQTVVREIREEVDLDVQVERLLCMAETIRPERGEHWISAIYVTRIVSGEARNREEGGAIGAIGWFALDELPENLACFTVPAVEKLLGEARSQA
ncbi:MULTISPECIES: NUDIX domain-containing protein [Brevibacillus]|uniref:MutT/nudix family protein n=1 Tax=Brevibacillus borstelensis AK1 TaxID=1300222 RepID=M8D609_9BACL|nr:NUDIX domain-containing protein [Brevibacillus borstelensis]EMT51704.1 MutT/nudix family protein [Brevibacillus borstelensis AK1]KKX56201.1 DNA mismatch repair protein MutT [Brevibacillus borstelensis cifa_chp40]MBE5397261.1 NUDIX domain-containing protein [Brevibacillus borstelensis]MCC0566699.1 NUDIX domain-containing protein [Brevibacillus borstelensis]MCM3470557.1 NUDIX domain-containing protein [Brevibacillus borstelensis]